MLKKPQWVALSAVVLLVVILLNLPGRFSIGLKLAIGGLFLPLFGLAGSADHLLDRAADATASRQTLARTLQELRRENDQLRIRVMQAEDLQRENTQLRQMLAWQNQAPWKLRPARVVGRDPANWWRTMQIDLGQRDGVTTNSPVLTAEGLVGRVAAVGQTRSQVVLVGDPSCPVAALIQDRDGRDSGIISAAASPIDTTLVDLMYLSKSSGVRPGQSVITSGLGGVFPKGILIGHVVDTRLVNFGLSVEARVKLSVRLNALDNVFVILP